MSDESDHAEKRTVDGVPVKLGDVVWRWQGWGMPRQRRLDKVALGPWWAMMSKEIYSTEQAALDAAIATERERLKRAQNQVRSTRRAITRLAVRRAETKERR